MLLSGFGFKVRCGRDEVDASLRPRSEFDRLPLGRKRNFAKSLWRERTGLGRGNELFPKPKSRSITKHVPSLARRQPCRSHVARAVESRAFWRVSW
jgi:hypothetical protein